MKRAGYRKYDTGAVAFRYVCHICNRQKSVRLFDIPPAEQAHRPGAVLKILAPERIDQLIRSIPCDLPDFIQDAWLAVLASPVETEEDVLEIASKVSNKRRNEFIKDRYALRSLDTPLDGNRVNGYSLADILHTHTDTISEVEDHLDAEHPVKPSLKVRIASMKDGEELDLSTVSRVEVAKAVSVVPEHISQIFMGKANCSLPLAYDIAKYLHTTVDYLYKAICGANGQNPGRANHNRFRPKATWKSFDPLPPKYYVPELGKGFNALIPALRAIGVEVVGRKYRSYKYLPDDLKARIVRNRATRGR